MKYLVVEIVGTPNPVNINANKLRTITGSDDLMVAGMIACAADNRLVIDAERDTFVDVGSSLYVSWFNK